MFEELKHFGLSDNEINVYVTLLKTGTTTANRISELAGIKRSTTYDNIHMLINKGIVSSIMKEGVNYYQAADPKKIIKLIDENKNKINQIIPQLLRIRESIVEKTGVVFYEGKKGVITVLNDILDEKKELWFYGSRKMALVALQHYPENFIRKRAEQKIKLKAVLAEEDRQDPTYKDKEIFAFSSLRFSKEMNNITTNVFIYSNRVSFMTSCDNPVGIIMKNKEILKQQQKIFTKLWTSAKK